MYKINIYGCAMFKKLVCQWVNFDVTGLTSPLCSSRSSPSVSAH